MSADPIQVADIFPGAIGSDPQHMVNANGTLYFDAGGPQGFELWKSDGTTAGTVLVKDINPGPVGSSPDEIVSMGGAVYFEADDGINGAELWKTDGTAAGTVLVKDILSGPGSSRPTYLTNVNGTLYFSARDSTGGKELWKSDGTADGTVRVLDIKAGAGSSDPTYVTNVNGTLYFTADNGISGRELWKTDGAGTVLVRDVFPGSDSSVPSSLTNVNGTLYFAASSTSGGHELWKSNGTESGTVQVKDIGAVSSSYGPTALTNVNGKVFFSAQNIAGDNELWNSDGTSEGTILLKTFEARFGDPLDTLTNVNGTLFFSAGLVGNNYELWKSDGTAAGTVVVKDIFAGATGSFPEYLTNFKGTLYFAADDGVSGRELWKSDGTATGTVLVKDIRPGDAASASFPINLTLVNNILYFNASDGVSGAELWSLSGTNTNAPPTDISLSSTSILENNAANAPVGTLSASDPNTGDTFIFSLASGAGSTDNASFSITGNTLKIIPVTNFATKSSYAIRILVMDQDGLTFEKQFTINVAQVNAAPTDISLSSTSVSENNTANANIGTLSATDPNLGNTFTFSLATGVGSTDNTSFTIVGNALKIIPVTNFATKNSYALRVRVTDQGGLTFDKQFTISVTQENAAPTDISLSSTSIAENNAANASIGTLGAIDPNLGNTFTFSLASGAGSTDNASFSIAGNTLKVIAVTDFETKNTYSVRIRSTDQGGLTFEKPFTIAIMDVNESAPNITLTSQPLAYHVSSKKAVALDSSATLANGNPALTLDGALLQVSGQAVKDTLSILKQNGIAHKGKNVLLGKTIIGTAVAGGKKGVPLTIRFTAAATQASVQLLLHNIGFKSTDKIGGSRNLQIQIANIGGVNTNQATRQILVD